jgi:hypothetical protein
MIIVVKRIPTENQWSEMREPGQFRPGKRLAFKGQV